MLVQIDRGACDALCEQKLYSMRQVRRAQGREMNRVERLWLVTDAVAPAPALLAAIEGTHVVRGDAQLAAAFPAERAATDHIYLVDPLGNLMLRFPRDPDLEDGEGPEAAPEISRASVRIRALLAVTTHALLSASVRGFAQRARAFYALTKPRVVSLIVFTAVIGMFLATPGMVPPQILLAGTLGIALVAGAAAAVNCLVEQKIDAVMQRTRARPLPRGELTSLQTLVFSGVDRRRRAVDPRALCESADDVADARDVRRLRGRSTPCS